MAVAALLAPSGCSLGGDKEPQPLSGAPRAIVATVDRLEAAIAKRDYAAVCDDLLTPAARKRAGGDRCARQLVSAGQDVRSPRIEIRGIDVKGDRAVVKVATEAEGQARVDDTLQLRRTSDGWRVEALS